MTTATTTFFDTLAASERLKTQGFTDQQARAMVGEMKAMREVDSEKLATKTDINELRISTKADVKELRLEIESKLKDVQIRLGGMIAALGGMLIAIRYFG